MNEAKRTELEQAKRTELEVVRIIHIITVLYILLGWMSNDILFLFVYIFGLINLKVHWFNNNDTCSLTLMEHKLTGKKTNETFFHQLVSPFYNIPENELGGIIHFATDFLFVLAVVKFLSHRDFFNFKSKGQAL